MAHTSPTDDALSRARTREEAVDLLVAAGSPRGDAEEVAAIAFGSSCGDVVVSDRQEWGSTRAAAEHRF